MSEVTHSAYDTKRRIPASVSTERRKGRLKPLQQVHETCLRRLRQSSTKVGIKTLYASTKVDFVHLLQRF